MSQFLEIINEIKEFFIAHKQVNDYGFGPSTNISTVEHKFPMVWTEPITTPISDFEIKYKFNIYSFTLYEQDKENLVNSLNDTQLILLDFISHFKHQRNDNYELSLDNINLDPFTAKFDNYTNGWILTIEFSTAYTYDNCNNLDG